ncbi:hypothetical protein CC117_04020 [Parafrankia colletiae]|uniref:Uncharacterized protein n=1 Tax=Parafrankia colletiae TaxID=573497 RepID=A0A1S1QZD7_9ACTN|nr:hypothetical protein [Parafrankia colletiae]MCK9899361.1 hypothetical protein [Frankia sp. Cpl3]OHV38889.1 hypothetical protein CC117_04020 [Parafrankia colletiae]
MTTWMWEARAAPGRVGELERWVRSAVAGRVAEIYLGRGESAGLVVVLLHIGGGVEEPSGAAGQPLLAPPDELTAGSAHAWQFERADAGLDRSDRLG